MIMNNVHPTAGFRGIYVKNIQSVELNIFSQLHPKFIGDFMVLSCSLFFFFLFLALKACWFLRTAVQEERQRGKERGENEVESTSSFNEEMPVDKILDAELAVEPKTETYSDGSPSNSVRVGQKMCC